MCLSGSLLTMLGNSPEGKSSPAGADRSGQTHDDSDVERGGWSNTRVFACTHTSFMMKTTKSVTTVTAPTRARFLAISQKAFLDERQNEVLKIATFSCRAKERRVRR